MAEPGQNEIPKHFEIRPLERAEDIQAVVDWEEKKFGADGAKEADLREYITNGNAFCLFENNTFAGYITLRRIEAGEKPIDYPDWPEDKSAIPYALIEQLTPKPYYEPESNHQYLREAKLFQAAEQRARELGCVKIFMAVPSSDQQTYNPNSYDCFRQVGYTIDPSVKATWDEKVNCTLIEKSL